MTSPLAEVPLYNIGAGILDNDLLEMRAAIDRRLAEIRVEKTIDDYGIGDKVQFNSSCGTRYLVGHTATVTGKRRTKVTVRLDKPTGRFVRMTDAGPVSAEITVPLSIIDAI